MNFCNAVIFAPFTALSTTTEKTAESIDQAVKSPLQFDWSIVTGFVTDGIPTILNVAIKVALAILVFFIGRKIIRILRKPVHKSIARTSLDTGVKQFVEQIIIFFLYIVLLVAILAVFGISASSVAALIASAGLSAGLALQGSLSNFAGGFLILALKPFRVGDYIREDANGNEGIVEEIQLCYTKLRTADRRILVLPNGGLSNCSLTNFSRDGVMAANFSLDIPMDRDPNPILKDLVEIMENEPLHYADLQPSAWINGITSDGVTIAFRLYCKTENYWSITSNIYDQVRKYLLANQIEIPGQHIEIHAVDKKN